MEPSCKQWRAQPGGVVVMPVAISLCISLMRDRLDHHRTQHTLHTAQPLAAARSTDTGSAALRKDSGSKTDAAGVQVSGQ